MPKYTITDIQFIETSDYQFRVNFRYAGLLLTISNLDRNISQDEVKILVLNTIQLSEQKRADDNYQLLKNTFEIGRAHV